MLKFTKISEDVVQISNGGDVTFSGSYQEESLDDPTLPSELQMSEAGDPKLDTLVVGANRDVRLKKRLFTQATFPLEGLQIKNPSGQVVAELHPTGNLYIRGVVTNPLDNPADPGAFSFSSIVYAAPGLDYSSSPSLSGFIAFESPTSSYTTRRIDISDFAGLGNFGLWPFTNEDVPINGLLRVPNGSGPFPLALFAHGNHSSTDNSTPGYIYLCDLLASHGIIAGTIDVNFLNGPNFGENDGRAIVHLEHIKQFKMWNEQAGHPLQGKVDLSKIMIVGHSRGGEGVGHASLFNTLAQSPDPPPVPLDGSQGLGPYNFGLKSVVAIAPTDKQYTPTTGPTTVEDNYFIVHGSRDGDISDFQGYQTYDRGHPINLSNSTQPAHGFKSLLWIYRANHNFFNSTWNQESSATITRSEQENIAKVYISAIAQAMLRNKSQYLGLLRDHTLGVANGWLSGSIDLVSQYQDQERLFIQHFEEAGSAITLSDPVNGTVDTSNIDAQKLFFLGGAGGHLKQETNGLRLDWTVTGKEYIINIDANGLPRGSFGVLALRVGQSSEANNQVDRNQDFTITISDSTNSFSTNAASLGSLLYPADPAGGGRKTVMQTFRIPLHLLQDNGVDVDNIRQISFLFDQPIEGTSMVQGTLYLDEIQLTG